MRKLAALADRIVDGVDVDSSTGCWTWLGYIKPNGYGTLSHGRRGSSRHFYVHRIAYELFVGEIAPGMVVHHLCYNRACANPEHLRQVTSRENVLDERSASVALLNFRKTHCKHGHEFTSENTYVAGDGTRHCRACSRLKDRRYRASRAAAAAMPAAYSLGTP